MIRVDAPDTISLLNRLFRIVSRSLPVYLERIQLRFGSTGRAGEELLGRIAADHRALARQIAAAIHEQGGEVDRVEFPIEFTAMNDVSVDFILNKTAQRLEHVLPTIQHTVEALAHAPAMQALAEQMYRLSLENLAAVKGILTEKR